MGEKMERTFNYLVEPLAVQIKSIEENANVEQFIIQPLPKGKDRRSNA